jgi:CRISPR-associated protein Csh2
LQDLTVDFGPLARVIEDMKNKEYVEKIIGWLHPLSDLSSLQNLPVFDETIDLWAPIPVVKKD